MVKKMTRDEFMEEAQKEIDQILLTPKSRLMNLVMKAWAEGKKNAEADVIEERANDILDVIRKQISDAAEAYKVHVTTPDIHFEHMLDWSLIGPLDNGIPSSCKTCSNHPSNGGSGICHCIMGIPQIKC